TRCLMVEAAYVGNVGHKLPGLREMNQAIYAAGATTGNTNARRPLAPTYQSIGLLSTASNSTYNSLQIRASQRFNHGLTFTSSYTWAKAINAYGGGAFANVGQQDPQNPQNLRADRGRDENDLRHRWVVRAGLRRLGAGWNLHADDRRSVHRPERPRQFA